MYIAKQNINGRDYFYIRKSVRTGEKVRSQNVAYGGKTRDEAEEKLRIFEEKVKDKKEFSDENKMEEIKITYFVHGTTIDNEDGISSGWKDVELSELGIKQSEELPIQIKGKKFDVVFCSDLKRAIDSAEISFKGKFPIKYDKRLRECNYGDFNGKSSEVVEPMQEKCINKKFHNGESYEDVKIRIKDFLDYLLKNYSGKSVAIVAHKAPQLALDVLIKGISWEQAFADDWRKNKKWQPGWDYVLKMEENIKKDLTIEELATFCKAKGFVFPSSEIYGGIAGFWDFGPLGVELFNNIKKSWWDFFVKQRDNMVGI